MMNRISLFIILCVFAIACNNAPEPTVDTATGDLYFGEKITKDGAIGVNELLTKMAATDSIDTKLTGTIESVCQKKGCWMNIQAENAMEGESVFVRFKDYGFFMPLDSKGRKVIMNGYAFKNITPVDELRHYAEDEGKSKEEINAITEPQEEYRYMASGVIILNE